MRTTHGAVSAMMQRRTWCRCTITAPSAQSRSTYVGPWQDLYPASLSYDNADCMLCHTTADGKSGLNPYGLDMDVPNNASDSLLTATLIAIDGDDSDNDLTGSSNLVESDASKDKDEDHMNKPLSGIIAALLIFPLASATAQTASDKIAEPQSLPASAKPISAAGDMTLATEKAAEKIAVTTASAPEKAPEPISGAFGIPLGEPFKASMVAKVLSKQEQIYTGPDGMKLKGSLLHVEPGKPDKRFQQYSLKTTDAGIIYAIQGDYQYKLKQDGAKPKGKGKGAGKPGNKKAKAIQSTCKAAVKTMAKELESLYGKPRGKGWDGLWFTFRQFSDTSSNRGLKLYGHRCRTGMYSIVYTDDKVQRGTLPGKASVSGIDNDSIDN